MNTKQAAPDTPLMPLHQLSDRAPGGDGEYISIKLTHMKRLLDQNEQFLSALQKCVSQCADFENMTDDCAASFRSARSILCKFEGKS